MNVTLAGTFLNLNYFFLNDTAANFSGPIIFEGTKKEALIVFLSIIGTLFALNILLFICLVRYIKRAKRYKIGMKKGG